MSDVAITRTEQYLNGIAEGENVDIEPVTRKELFLAKAAGMDVETPDPVTREEMYLSKISGGSSGGVSINNQDKTITQNGTYTADEGYTGLGTVNVNVESSGDDESQFDAFIEGKVTEISSNASSVTAHRFYQDAKLTTVSFPLAEIIGTRAFYGCTKLQTIHFPKATAVNEYAFNNCSLQTVNLPLVTFVNKYAFYGCSQMTAVDIPLANKVYNSAFYGCSKLTDVNMPRVTEILSSGFSGCTALEVVDFPLLEKIVDSAFYKCTSLKAVILRRAVMTPLSTTQVFTSSLIATGGGYIYVPSALIEEYKAATNWSTYADQFRALEDYTVDGTITGELDESKI